MAYTMADLELVERHIAQGERHIVAQEELISRLRSRGLPTDKAESLLKQFHETLRDHYSHRDVMRTAVYGDSL